MHSLSAIKGKNTSVMQAGAGGGVHLLISAYQVRGPKEYSDPRYNIGYTKFSAQYQLPLSGMRTSEGRYGGCTIVICDKPQRGVMNGTASI